MARVSEGDGKARGCSHNDAHCKGLVGHGQCFGCAESDGYRDRCGGVVGDDFGEGESYEVDEAISGPECGLGVTVRDLGFGDWGLELGVCGLDQADAF